MPRILRIAHLAVVTDDMESALAFWRDALGLELGGVHHVAQEGVRVAFLPVGESALEVVFPTEPETGVARFLAKRGPGMHHVCFEVDDLEGLLDELKARGVQLIHEIPQVAPSGRRYAFVHPKSTGGVLVELYEASQEGTEGTL